MSETEPGNDAVRIPQSQRPGGKKRKVALFVAFVGAGYSVSWQPLQRNPQGISNIKQKSFKPSVHVQGMQHNPGCNTIEGELGRAMHKAGAISDENAGNFSKVCISAFTIREITAELLAFLLCVNFVGYHTGMYC